MFNFYFYSILSWISHINLFGIPILVVRSPYSFYALIILMWARNSWCFLMFILIFSLLFWRMVIFVWHLDQFLFPCLPPWEHLFNLFWFLALHKILFSLPKLWWNTTPIFVFHLFLVSPTSWFISFLNECHKSFLNFSDGF